nr:MAG TPA: late expression factor 9-like protein [Caudoviricetes sp.]
MLPSNVTSLPKYCSATSLIDYCCLLYVDPFYCMY